MSLEISETPLDVAEEPLLPVRMLNKLAYCPSLAYLEWIQSEFADSVNTVNERCHHRRLDESPKRQTPGDKLLSPDEDTVIHQRSLWFSSEQLELTADIDLVEEIGACVAPCEGSIL